MAEYIEREAVLKCLEYCPIETSNVDLIPAVLETVRRKVVRLPYREIAADVVEVVHGRWVKVRGNVWACDHCGAETVSDTPDCTPAMSASCELFCYYCGARMDGDG